MASTRIPGIQYDLVVRWEQGIPHHPESIKLYKRLEEIDWMFGSDYFCWKSGGDGDNGETLMYELDILFEERDKQKEDGHGNSGPSLEGT